MYDCLVSKELAGRCGSNCLFATFAAKTKVACCIIADSNCTTVVRRHLAVISSVVADIACSIDIAREENGLPGKAASIACSIDITREENGLPDKAATIAMSDDSARNGKDLPGETASIACSIDIAREENRLPGKAASIACSIDISREQNGLPGEATASTGLSMDDPISRNTIVDAISDRTPRVAHTVAIDVPSAIGHDQRKEERHDYEELENHCGNRSQDS
jgi:hypothetical protein